MEVIDSQVHANQRGIDQSIAIMDAVGVDAAVIDIWPPVRRTLPNGVHRFAYAFGEEAGAPVPPPLCFLAPLCPYKSDGDCPIAPGCYAAGPTCNPRAFR